MQFVCALCLFLFLQNYEVPINESISLRAEIKRPMPKSLIRFSFISVGITFSFVDVGTLVLNIRAGLSLTAAISCDMAVCYGEHTCQTPSPNPKQEASTLESRR